MPTTLRRRIPRPFTLISLVGVVIIIAHYSHRQQKQVTCCIDDLSEIPPINKSLLSTNGTGKGARIATGIHIKINNEEHSLTRDGRPGPDGSQGDNKNNTKRKRAGGSQYREQHWNDYLKSLHIMAEKAKGTTVVPVTRPVEEPVQCSLLMSGDQQEIKRTKLKLSVESYVPPDDSEFLNVHENCAEFVKSNRYHEQPKSKEEEEFPLAFTLRMHADVAMAEMLLRNIYHPQNIYCVHIDKKSPPVVHRAMESIAKCLPNVFVTNRNVNYTYGSFSAVEADLVCMQELLNSSIQWKYLLNMAGSEFPLKTNLELVRVLKLLNGTNDIEQFYWPARYNLRINSSAIKDYAINYVIPSGVPKAPFRTNITLMKGCSYNTFSRAFVDWVLKDPLAQEFINWTRDTMSPDETVWGTLNYLPQAPGGYQVEITETAKTFLSREIIWAWSSAYCWEQHFVRGICILSSRDLGWLSQRWEFFANKFDLRRDHYVVECLQESLRDRTKRPDPDHYINWDTIKRFPHISHIA